MTDKIRAIELARRVVGAKDLGLMLTPSEAMLLAEQYLRELGLLFRRNPAGDEGEVE